METYDMQNGDSWDGGELFCPYGYSVDAETDEHHIPVEIGAYEPITRKKKAAPASEGDIQIDRAFQEIKSLGENSNNGHQATFDRAVSEILSIYMVEREIITREVKAERLFKGDESQQAAYKALLEAIETYLKDKRPVVGFAAYLRFQTTKEIKKQLKKTVPEEECGGRDTEERVASLLRKNKGQKAEGKNQDEEMERLFALYNTEGGEKAKQVVGLKIHRLVKGRINSNISRYLNLSQCIDAEDLEQLSYIAVFEALGTFKDLRAAKMKFSTYLDWHIRKEFQKTIGSHDKEVEVYDHDGTYKQTMEYSDFIKKVRMIRAAGMSYVQKSRLVAYADGFESHRNQVSAEESLIDRESTEYFKSNLLPELYEMYAAGALPEPIAARLAEEGLTSQKRKLKILKGKIGKEELKDIVGESFNMVKEFHELAEKKVFSLREAQKRAASKISKVKHNEAGCVSLCFRLCQLLPEGTRPSSEVDTANLSDSRSTGKKDLFAEAMEICAEKGEAFVEQAEPEGNVLRILYAKAYGPWRWVIGAEACVQRNGEG